MTLARFNLIALAAIAMAVCSCQTADPEPEPEKRVAPSLNYTMLGIWPQRYQAYEISQALKQAGIGTQLSGYRPCILNVEASRLSEAQAIVNANPQW